MPSALHERTVMPPDDLSSLSRFASGLAEPIGPGKARLIGPDGSELELPEELYGLLRDVVRALSQGVAISIAPRNTMLTTQEAADLLNISRPTLIRLLNEEQIPHTMRGRHRRVMLRDVIDYQDRMRAERRRTLDEMTADAEDMDLYTITKTPGDLG
ncbi:helix-turn-helix domain-containing protein [Actinoplanes sp. NPDC049548]|uniref:helix-turn-helix domain-containing protein n=1 Tax=Actinoplanes sp. NPDC049548 TaxID=3155152 RepID=UPI0034324724